MKGPGKSSIALLSIAALALGQEKDLPKFTVKPAGAYAAKQSLDGVVIGIEALDSAETAKAAFGKVNPNQYGILPVLVVIENKRPKSLRLDRINVTYVIPGAGKIEATPAPDVPYAVYAPSRPNPAQIPLPIPRKSKKSPLAIPEIEGRAFAAKMLAPGDTASGFFYFQSPHRASARLYVAGLIEAGSNQELFYYEVPFN